MTTIALILTSHGDLGDTGRSTGWYVPEAAEPWQRFNNAGLKVVFVSSTGGHSPMDGLNPDDPVQRAFLEHFGSDGPNTIAIRDFDRDDVAAVLYVGGHGAMWDLPNDTEIAALTARVYEAGGVVAAVCHGPAGLVNVKLSDGTYLIAGKNVAAFTNDEERAVGLEAVVPFMLADRLVENGARHHPAANFAANTVTDGRLITGQNPASATGVADAVLTALAAGDAA